MIPKFRAWDKETKTMYDVKSIVYTLGSMLCVNRSALFPERTLYFEDTPVMQSTGLLDVNGKEIFEGDIIVAMSQGVKVIGEVKRRIDGYWLMYPAWQHGELWHIVENVDTGETGVEVIGNIYENPELVEEVDDDQQCCFDWPFDQRC